MKKMSFIIDKNNFFWYNINTYQWQIQSICFAPLMGTTKKPGSSSQIFYWF